MTFFNPGPQILKPMVIGVFNHSKESEKTKLLVADVAIMKFSGAVEHHLSKLTTFVSTAEDPVGILSASAAKRPCCFVDLRPKEPQKDK